MTLAAIKTAVNAGKTVCWKNTDYKVVFTHDWFIQCSNGHCIGLTWADGETLNAKPDSFYIAN